MGRAFLKALSFIFVLGICVADSLSLAEPLSPALLKAKQEAEAKGYIFIPGRSDIVENAKKEGKLRVLTDMEPLTIKALTAAFMTKYPFIDLYIQEITGPEAHRRNLLEIRSGRARDWDVLNISINSYAAYIPHLWKVDLLGMAEQGVLNIPSSMIDLRNRNIGAYFSQFQVTAYNNHLLSSELVPRRWEDLLKPEFTGKKFAADLHPTEIAALVPAWGLEKTLEFAHRLAAQQPIWVRGGSRTLVSMVAGEIPLFIGPNYSAVKRAQRKDAAGRLNYVILEPVPVRLSANMAIQLGARNPHAALLWLEWMASSEAQKLADEHEPLSSSVYARGSAVEKEIRGKILSVVSWEHLENMEKWQSSVFEAYGFPTAEKRR